MILKLFKKYKYLFFVLAIVLIALPFATPASALELNYPVIPGYSYTCQTGSGPSYQCFDFISYVMYFFMFVVTISGIIAVMFIAFSAFEILISGGSAERISDAKERILGCILGIALLFCSFILLNTINPGLVGPSTLQPTLIAGQVYYRGNNGGGASPVIDSLHPDGYVYQIAPQQVPDTNNTNDMPAGFDGLYYYCGTVNTSDPTVKTLLVWVYSKVDYEIDRPLNATGSDNVKTFTVSCNNFLPLKSTSTPILSWKRDYQYSGIYLYLTADCGGIASDNIRKSENVGSFDGTFTRDIVKSVKIVNPPSTPNLSYGVLFTTGRDNIGACSDLILKTGSATCYNIPANSDGSSFSTGSLQIIKQDINPSSTNSLSFYSENLIATINQSEFTNNYYSYPNSPDALLYNDGSSSSWTGNFNEDECSPGSGPSNTTCLETIETSGNYYIILYAHRIEDSSFKQCEIFTSSTINKDDFEYLLRDIDRFDHTLYKMNIIPRY